ncbi:MAG: hypothetical protein J6S74_02560 [Alphaproteobacteria bacterium]|nr:hypothetical protein [Alphaproteobacteria bacterium]
MIKTKVVFPPDWSQMTDAGVMDNINYILKNLKKYNLMVINENTLHIDDVRIVFYTVEQHGQCIKVAKVNNRIVRSDKNSDLFLAIQKLYDKCKRNRIKKYERLGNNKQDTSVGSYVATAVVLAVIFVIVMGNLKKQEKAKQEKIEWAKELLKNYDAERAKSVTVNIDSLINRHVR